MKNREPEETFVVIDEGDLRKFRIELPNLVDDLGLSVYAFRLYVHYKRVAGANPSGTCKQGTRLLSEKCKMSVGMISNAKAELVAAKLITVEQRDRTKGESDVIRLKNIWRENFMTYMPEPKEDEQPVHVVNTPPVHCMNTPVHTVNTPVHVVNERKNQLENKPIENKPREDQSAQPTPQPLPSAEKQEEKPKPKAKEKTPANAGTQPIMDAYVEALAYDKPLPNRKHLAALASAKEIAEAGFSPEDVTAAYHKLKGDKFWQDKHLTLSYILDQLPALIQFAKNGGRNNNHATGKYNITGLGGSVINAPADPGYSTVSKQEQEEWLAQQPPRPF